MIYEPREDSFLMEKAVKKYAYGKVLDMGTGSGIQAIAAAKNKNVKSITAVDINKEAVMDALQNAMSMIKVGVKSKDVGRKIQSTITDMGLKPIANLSGHSLDQYTIHAGKTVPNMWTIGSFSFSENEAFACEPFVTTKNGLGFVRNGKIKNIYAIVTRKKTNDNEADRLLEYIWTNFNTLPFALRWLLKEWEEKEARKLLEFLIKKKIVRAYEVLVEANGKTVAQAEHTFIPTQSGVTITTIG